MSNEPGPKESKVNPTRTEKNERQPSRVRHCITQVLGLGMTYFSLLCMIWVRIQI